jgi:hypothetical protein
MQKFSVGFYVRKETNMLRKDHQIMIEQGSSYTTILLEDKYESSDKRFVHGKWRITTEYSHPDMKFGSENPEYSYWEWRGHATMGNLEIGFLMDRGSQKEGEESKLFWVKIALAHVRRSAMSRFESMSALGGGGGVLRYPEFHNYILAGPILWTPIRPAIQN